MRVIRGIIEWFFDAWIHILAAFGAILACLSLVTANGLAIYHLWGQWEAWILAIPFGVLVWLFCFIVYAIYRFVENGDW